MQKLTTKRRSQESRSPVDRDAANRCESLNPNTSSGSGAVKSWLRNTQLVAHTTQSVENKTSAVTVVDRSLRRVHTVALLSVHDAVETRRRRRTGTEAERDEKREDGSGKIETNREDRRGSRWELIRPPANRETESTFSQWRKKQSERAHRVTAEQKFGIVYVATLTRAVRTVRTAGRV